MSKNVSWRPQPRTVCKQNLMASKWITLHSYMYHHVLTTFVKHKNRIQGSLLKYHRISSPLNEFSLDSVIGPVAKGTYCNITDC